VLTAEDILYIYICQERLSWLLKFGENIWWPGSAPNPTGVLSAPSQKMHPCTLQPRYNARRFSAHSVIMLIGRWIPLNNDGVVIQSSNIILTKWF